MYDSPSLRSSDDFNTLMTNIYLNLNHLIYLRMYLKQLSDANETSN